MSTAAEWALIIGALALVAIAFTLSGIRQSLNQISNNLFDIKQSQKLMENQNGLLHSIASRLDRIWSPLKGISNALWQAQGRSPDEDLD